MNNRRGGTTGRAPGLAALAEGRGVTMEAAEVAVALLRSAGAAPIRLMSTLKEAPGTMEGDTGAGTRGSAAFLPGSEWRYSGFERCHKGCPP